MSLWKRWGENTHNLKLTMNRFEEYTSVAFVAFTVLCNDHLCLIQRRFITLKGARAQQTIILRFPSPSHPPSPPFIPSKHSFALCLCGVIYSGYFMEMQLYHTWLFVWGFFHLAWCFKVHPCCSLCQSFIPFYDWEYSIVWVDCVLFIHHPLLDSELFPPFSSCEWCSCEHLCTSIYLSFPGGSVVKNLPANSGDAGDAGSIPGSGRSPGGGNGHPLQYSCLGNPMDRGAWWATVCEVAKSRTRLSKYTYTIYLDISFQNSFGVYT